MAEWELSDDHIGYARGNAARLSATIRWEAQTESRIGQWFRRLAWGRSARRSIRDVG